MAVTTTNEQSAANMEYVRRLLKLKQPGFSAALESAADLVRQELRDLRSRPGDNDLGHEFVLAKLRGLSPVPSSS
jgi:hypothetical protein